MSSVKFSLYKTQALTKRIQIPPGCSSPSETCRKWTVQRVLEGLVLVSAAAKRHAAAPTPAGMRRRMKRSRQELVGRDKGSLTEQQTEGNRNNNGTY